MYRNMSYKFGVFLLLLQLCSSQNDSKWVWGEGRRRNENIRVVNSDRRYNGELASKPLFQANSNFNDRPSVVRNRYEVTETYPSDYTTYRPRPPEYYRPDSSGSRPISSYRPPPDYVRPTNSLDNYRPPNRPYEYENRPIGNGYRPPNGDYSLHGLRPGIGTNGRPILTGPTPSWVEDGNHKYKDYNVCKCVHSFNCNTPGIKFGSCDTDKQYCCYKGTPNEGGENIGKPITNIYERPRPVLAGPGGPVDRPGTSFQNKVRPYRPEYDRFPDPDRDLNEAYKKGLESALYEHYQRPNSYYDRDPQGYREYYYPGNRDPYKGSNNYKTSHPSKYGLYDPSVYSYARSANSSILAINDKN